MIRERKDLILVYSRTNQIHINKSIQVNKNLEWQSYEKNEQGNKSSVGDRLRSIHNIQDVSTMEYLSRNISRIYETLYNRHAYNQSNIIQVEINISNQPTILINSITCHSYITPNLVEIFQLKRIKHEKYWIVQLAIGTNKKNQ